MRRGDGTSRANLREFLRGLYDAGGEGPPTKGVVLVVGIGQRVREVGTYKARTQEWLQDSAFWSDANAYVSDWSQEVYGDVRSYAAPGAPTASRRDALVDYLRHADLRRGGRSGVRYGERVLRRRGEPARERGVPVGLRVRLHARRARPDAALRLGAGLRASEPQRALGPSERPLGLRVVTAEHLGRFPPPTGRR